MHHFYKNKNTPHTPLPLSFLTKKLDCIYIYTYTRTVFTGEYIINFCFILLRFVWLVIVLFSSSTCPDWCWLWYYIGEMGWYLSGGDWRMGRLLLCGVVVVEDEGVDGVVGGGWVLVGFDLWRLLWVVVVAWITERGGRDRDAGREVRKEERLYRDCCVVGGVRRWGFGGG